MSELYSTEDKTMPAVSYALLLAGFATGGLTAVVGVIIAYAQRGLAGPVMSTHYTFMIRTFWIGLVWCVAAGIIFGIGVPLSFILIGIPLLLLAKAMWALGAVWYAVRCILGLIQVSRGDAYPRPYAILA